MTPSMGMAAPKGMAAAPQAGLAAIAQPATAPKGMSSGNMAQVMALARKMSDGQLAEVLQGKSLDVPQYVAMTEAMGRKSLRTAMQGQQAMAQAQQPSVKDKLLMGDQPQMSQGMPQMPQQPMMAAQGGLMYSDGGISSLPAPNMDSMDMASGGIVAFDEGGEVPRFNEGGNWFTELRDSLYTPEERRIEDMKRGRKTDQPTDTLSENQVNALLRGKTPGPAEAPMPPASMQSEIDASKMRLFRQEMAAKEDAANTKPVFAGPAKPIAPVLTPPGAGSGPDKTKAGIGGTDEFSSYMDMVKKNREGYLSKLEGMGAKQREGLAKLRSEGGGEALMNLAGALFANPNMAMALGKGMPALAQTAAASRKEQRAVEQGANEMDLNLAKAQEAASRGDMESALMFKKMADEASYRNKSLALQAAQVNKPDAGIAMLNALKDPANMAIYRKMYESRTPTDVVDREKAAALWEKLSRNEKRNKYGDDFETYYTSMNNRLLSATIPGQGANVIGTLK
jgi:hypothetical protein